jgi:hypothetical protein
MSSIWDNPLLKSKALLMPISRRSVLRGLSATTAILIASPLSSALAACTSNGYAKRFILAGLHNGVDGFGWYPNTVAPNGTTITKLGRTFSQAGFDTYRDKMLIIQGLNLEVLNSPLNTINDIQHVKGLATWSSGGPGGYVGGGTNGEAICLTPTLDQILAPILSAQCPIKAPIHWSFRNTQDSSLVRTVSSYAYKTENSTISMPPEIEPIDLYNKLARGITSDTKALPEKILTAPHIDEMKLILNRFKADGEIYQMLEQHFDALNSIFNQYNSTVDRPANFDEPAATAYAETVKKMDLNIELTGLALIAGLSNVFNINILPSGMRTNAGYAATPETGYYSATPTLNTTSAQFNDHGGGVHGWSHSKYTGDFEFSEIQSFHLKRIKRLCDILALQPEADGTMLDNTLIYIGSEISHVSHDQTMMPIAMIGGAGDYFGAMGRLVKLQELPTNGKGDKFVSPDFKNDSNYSHSRALLAAARACGFDGDNIGGTDYCPSTEISGLRAC